MSNEDAYRKPDPHHAAIIRFAKDYHLIADGPGDHQWSRGELTSMLDDASKLGIDMVTLREMLAEGG